MQDRNPHMQARLLDEIACKTRHTNRILQSLTGLGGGTTTINGVKSPSISEVKVTDNAGTVHIRRLVHDPDANTFTITYHNPSTNVTTVPTFPLRSEYANIINEVEYFPATIILTDTPVVIEAKYDGTTTTYKRLDTGALVLSTSFEPLSSATSDSYELVAVYDNNNVIDNSNVTKIFEQVKIDKDGLRTFTNLYYKEDTYTLHTLVGTVVRDIGIDTQANVVTFQLGNIAPNNTFTTSGLMQVVTIDVISIADLNNPPTITTRVDPNDPLTTLVKPLRENRTISFETTSDDIRIIPGVIITAQPGDIIDIIYTTKTTL